jgi:hypothetical protein
MNNRLGAAVLLMLASVVSCDDNDPVAVSPMAALSSSVVAALDTAIQDEYHAEQIYLRVLVDFGNVLPFFNVVVAEQRHSASLSAVYERRGLAVPGSAWNTDNVPTFATLQAACAAAAAAEVANIEMYDRFLTLDLATDVRNVLNNNRNASLTKHYPAFMQCR